MRTTIVALFVLAALAICPLFESRAAERRSLKRTEDFIVLAGKDLAPLLGAEIVDLRLYSCKEGACAPVPMQADQRDEYDRFVFASETNSDRDGTTLDENDEVAFMASDAGDKAVKEDLPDGVARAAEIELKDPLDGGLAWLYLLDMPGSPAPDTADYIDYIKGDGRVTLKSDQYELGWGLGMINADYMRLRQPDGTLSGDVLDRQKVGLQAKLVGDYSMPINAPESLVSAEDIAVIDGPIRVIIDQVVVLNLADFQIQWGTEYFVKYYRNGQNNSVYFSFPTSANVLQTISFYWTLDMTEDMVGSTYIDGAQAKPIKIEPGRAKGIGGDKPHYWWGLYGDRGAVFQALDLDDDMLDYFACEGKWRQNPDALDRKGDKGRLEIGFSCGEVGQVPDRQDYHWFNYILFPRDAGPDGIRAMKNFVLHPLEYSARAMAAD